jgi:hypothetical protein
MLAAIEGYPGMIKAAAAVVGAVVLALGVLSQPSPAKAQLYNSHLTHWTVGQGFFGFSSYPWAGPPFATPLLKPTYGCYFTRARLQNAWRRVEVCE